MSHRPFTPVRALLGAALLSALAPATSRAAALALHAADDGNYRCAVHITHSAGDGFTSDITKVTSGSPAFIHIGPLRAALGGDSPQFESLKLRCWRRYRATLDNPLGLDRRSYALTLYRWESFWIATDPVTGLTHANLPRDGSVVSLALATTQQPTSIRIVRAWATHYQGNNSAQLQYNMLDAYHRLSAE